MKPEPLRNYYFHYHSDDENGDLPMISKRRIKSAVEWYDNKLIDIAVDNTKSNNRFDDGIKFTIAKCRKLLNEAFEDVVKE